MNILSKIIASILVLKLSALAVTFEEAKAKADQKGGNTLSFDECSILGSKFGNLDKKGRPHPDGGFHCAYISDIYEKKKLDSLQKKAKIEEEDRKKSYELEIIRKAEAEKKAEKIEREWNNKKNNSKLLKFGKEYNCNSNKNYSSITVGLGKHSMDIGNESCYFTDEYENFYLYRCLNTNIDQIIKVKVFKKYESSNESFQYNGIKYYCD